MQSAELQIPQLATQAGRAAHLRAVGQGSGLVMKTANGQLVERQASGHLVVIKTLPAATATRPGMVLTRASKPVKKVASR
jgi:hypothetical protein